MLLFEKQCCCWCVNGYVLFTLLRTLISTWSTLTLNVHVLFSLNFTRNVLEVLPSLRILG